MAAPSSRPRLRDHASARCRRGAGVRAGVRAAATAVCVLAAVTAAAEAAGNRTPPTVPLGTVGGHLSIAQLHAYLSSIAADFPDAVSPLLSLGTSKQNRDLWCVCIGFRCAQQPHAAAVPADQPTPALLLTGQHHSREVRLSFCRSSLSLLARCVPSPNADTHA